jgi:hypothetical protein
MVIRIIRDYGRLVKVELKEKKGVGKAVSGWVESYGICWGSSYVFGCISAFAVECVGGRSSVVTGCVRMRMEGEDRRKSG